MFFYKFLFDCSFVCLAIQVVFILLLRRWNFMPVMTVQGGTLQRGEHTPLHGKTLNLEKYL